MPQMNIIQIQTSRRWLFNNFCNALYNNCINDLGANDFHLLGNLADADGIVKLFRDGFAPMMLNSKDMQRVEQCNTDDVPFIIVVTLETTIFAVVNGDDVTY